MDTGAWACSDFWVDWLIRYWHRLLLAFEDGGIKTLDCSPELDVMGIMSNRRHFALADRSIWFALAHPFFPPVRQHKPKHAKSDLPILCNSPQGWMKLVVASTIGFYLALLWNVTLSLCVAVQNIGPQYPQPRMCCRSLP